MGCSIGPQEFLLAVSANDGTGSVTGDPPVCDGFFNPVTGLLDTTQFDRVRLTMEVLSFTANVRLMFGGSGSPDGVEFEPNPLPIGEAINPNSTTWARTGWITAAQSTDYIQAGVFGFRAGGGGSIREMAVIRFRIEFKMGT